MHPHLEKTKHTHSAFGEDRIGRWAESFARFFGTGKFIVGQTILIIVWISLNVLCVTLQWDPYPFILLNLLFSTQAAYAAPLILLAQNRQADREKALAIAAADHQEEVSQDRAREAAEHKQMLQEVAILTKEIHSKIDN